MFLLVCGENSPASRDYIADLKNTYRKKGYDIREVAPRDLDEIRKSDAFSTLFQEKIIYITQGLLPYLSRQKKKIAIEIEALQKDNQIELIDWEADKSLYDLKLKPASYIKEFKVDATIFQLQDAYYPGNKEAFLKLLHTLALTQDQGFLYTMLHRHARLIMLFRMGVEPPGVSPWQKSKVALQAKKWQPQNAQSFYEGLTRIDAAMKTSSSPFSILESIEILACYYM